MVMFMFKLNRKIYKTSMHQENAETQVKIIQDTQVIIEVKINKYIDIIYNVYT